MDEDINPALGISRRDLLRRGAVVGGTLVWAAPAVQTISRAALAQTTGTPAPTGQAISFLAFVLHNDGTTKYKFEDQGGDCKLEAGGEPKPCEHVLSDAQKLQWSNAATDTTTTKVTVDCSDPYVWVIDPADNYGVEWAVVKSGADGKCSLFGWSPKGASVQVFQK